MRLRFPAVAALLFLSFTVTASAQAPGQLPPLPQNTPKVGDKAPDFTLPDTTSKTVKLSEVLAEPGPKGQKGSWVLLIFYRGYW